MTKVALQTSKINDFYVKSLKYFKNEYLETFFNIFGPNNQLACIFEIYFYPPTSFSAQKYLI